MMMGILAGQMRSAPTSDPYWSSVVSLLHFDGADGSTTFTDQAGAVWTPTGNAKVSTTNPRFGTGSLDLDGVGSFISGTAPGFAFGTADFTIELQMRIRAAAEFTLLDNRFGTYGQAMVLYDSVSGVADMNLTYYAAGANRAVSGALTNATYYHVALCRSSGVTRFFLQGLQQGASYADANNYTGTQLRIGGNYLGTANNSLNGNIDEVRITAGIARYTGNFTPPTAAFPNS